MNKAFNSLILADGTVLEGSSCGFSNKTLWCWVSGLSMADCFSIFSNPEKTSEITVLYYTSGIRYRGFIDMQIIRKGMDETGTETIDIKMVPVGDNYSIENFEREMEDADDAEVS